MIDLEYHKNKFKNHKATLTKYDNITILDFKDPENNYYRIRFLFEEDYCRLHISGDLGELIATNHYNMSYEGFEVFLNNPGYFIDKVDCHNRLIFCYDEDLARKQLIEYIAENNCESVLLDNEYTYSEDYTVEDVINRILYRFSEKDGISLQGYNILTECNLWELCEELGKESTGIIELYMLAFKLAQEDLKKQEADVIKNSTDNVVLNIEPILVAQNQTLYESTLKHKKKSNVQR